ncbi:hypothetical protein BH23VER1_BH23VER1_13060 [soil metagenome]
MSDPRVPASYSFGFTCASLRPELVAVMAEIYAELGS